MEIIKDREDGVTVFQALTGYDFIRTVRKSLLQIVEWLVGESAKFSRVEQQVGCETVRFFLLLPGLFRVAEMVVDVMTNFMSDSEVLTFGAVVLVHEDDLNSAAYGNTAAKAVVKVNI